MTTGNSTESAILATGTTLKDEGAAAGIGRRRMLGLLASGAAVLGLNSAAVAAEPVAGMPPAREGEIAPEQLFAQARLRSYKTRPLLKLGPQRWQQRCGAGRAGRCGDDPRRGRCRE